MPKDLKTISDEELMLGYQNGNAAEFDALYSRHSGRIYGFILNRVSKKREAEDLMQEVFFKLHRSKHLYNSTLPFTPWLFSITRSVFLDFLKKKNLEDPVEIADLDKIAMSEESKIEHDLVGLVSNLPKSQSDAVSLRIFDENTFEEIASRLSTSPDNARQLVSRGMKKIRQALGRKED